MDEVALNEMQDIPQPGQDSNWLTTWRNFKKLKYAVTVYNVKDYGAKGDGVNDDTAAILRAVAALSAAGGGRLYFPLGYYRTSATIFIPSNCIVEGTGRDVTIIKPLAGFTVISYFGVFGCDRVSNIDFLDFTVDANKAELGAVALANCIGVMSSSNVYLECLILKNCPQEVSGNGGDGLELGRAPAHSGAERSMHIVANDVICKDNVRQGLSLIACEDFTFNACRFEGTTGSNPGAGVDFESNEAIQIIRDGKFDNCLFYNNETGIFVANTQSATVKNINFNGCRFTGNRGHNITMENAENCNITFTGGMSDAAGDCGVRLSGGTTFVYFTDFTITGSTNYNLEIRTGVRNIRYNGGAILLAGKDGARINYVSGAGNRIALREVRIFNNGQSSLGIYDGVVLLGDSVNDGFSVDICDNWIGNVPQVGTLTQRHGVRLMVNSRKAHVLGNRFYGSVGNPVQFESTILFQAGGYVSAIAGDIGKTVTFATSGATAKLVDYDNAARLWTLRQVVGLPANAEGVSIATGTGAGTTAAASAFAGADAVVELNYDSDAPYTVIDRGLSPFTYSALPKYQSDSLMYSSGINARTFPVAGTSGGLTALGNSLLTQPSTTQIASSAQEFEQSVANSGGVNSINIRNEVNTASTRARFLARVLGTSALAAYNEWNVGSNSWYGGHEASSGDFVLGYSGTFATNPRARITSAGVWTVPNLAGTGSRLLQADSNGLISASLVAAAVPVAWTKTASTTVANSTTETTLLDTGVGSKTLAAALLTVGKTVEFEIYGVYSTTLTPTIQFKFKLGSTVILDSGAITTANTVTNQPFCFYGTLTCRTTGATGTVFAQGGLVLGGLATPLIGVANTGTATIDTTGTLAMDITSTWGSLSLSDSITATNAVIKTLG